MVPAMCAHQPSGCLHSHVLTCGQHQPAITHHLSAHAPQANSSNAADLPVKLIPQLRASCLRGSLSCMPEGRLTCIQLLLTFANQWSSQFCLYLQVVSVDCNPAQSALLELKATAIRYSCPAAYLTCSHACIPPYTSNHQLQDTNVTCRP